MPVASRIVNDVSSVRRVSFCVAGAVFGELEADSCCFAHCK